MRASPLSSSHTAAALHCVVYMARPARCFSERCAKLPVEGSFGSKAEVAIGRQRRLPNDETARRTQNVLYWHRAAIKLRPLFGGVLGACDRQQQVAEAARLAAGNRPGHVQQR